MTIKTRMFVLDEGQVVAAMDREKWGRSFFFVVAATLGFNLFLYQFGERDACRIESKRPSGRGPWVSAFRWNGRKQPMN
jgi:hypothetical protein